MKSHLHRYTGYRRFLKKPEPSWQVTIDKKFRVPLLGLSVKVGTRLYFSVPKECDGVRISMSPKGALRNGRYLSIRVQKVNISQRRFNPKLESERGRVVMESTLQIGSYYCQYAKHSSA